MGRLGRAIINYPGFTPEGFNIVAAFDVSPAELGENVGSLVIQPIEELEPTIP